MYVFGCGCIYVVSDMRRLDDSFYFAVSRRLAAGLLGTRDLRCRLYRSPLAAAQAEACLEGLLLPLVLTGLAGHLKDTMLRCRLGGRESGRWEGRVWREDGREGEGGMDEWRGGGREEGSWDD